MRRTARRASSRQTEERGDRSGDRSSPCAASSDGQARWQPGRWRPRPAPWYARGVPDRDGQIVLVTGAASGIGRATVARVAASGAAVALVDRDAERLASAVPAGARAISIVADVAREADVRDAVARVAEELGGLGGLVTAAGIFDPAERRPVA